METLSHIKQEFSLEFNDKSFTGFKASNRIAFETKVSDLSASDMMKEAGLKPLTP